MVSYIVIVMILELTSAAESTFVQQHPIQATTQQHILVVLLVPTRI